MRFGWVAAVVLGVAQAAFGAMTGEAGGVASLLGYVPQGAEVVVGVELAQLTAHPAFPAFYGRMDPAKLDSAIAAVQQATGVHLLKDIEAILMAGELKEGGRSVLYLKGRWDSTRLLSLVNMNATYAKQVYGGLDIHEWIDDTTGKKKYASFLADGVLALSDWVEVLRLVVDTAAGAKPALNGVALPSGAGGGPADLMVVAWRPASPGPGIQSNPVLNRVVAMSLGLDAGETDVTVRVQAQADSDSAAALLCRLAEGATAFAQLAGPAAGAAPWRVTAEASGPQVQASAVVPMEQFLELAGYLRGLKKPAQTE